MTDWKEERIADYLTLENGKRAVEEQMASDPQIMKLKSDIQAIADQVNERMGRYKEYIHYYETKMSNLKEDFVERWDNQDKSFKCNAGSATIRTTRALKIRNKEELIPILQKMDKLADCITGWDISYLRKLVDVGLIKPTIASYEEKQSIIIGAVRK